MAMAAAFRSLRFRLAATVLVAITPVLVLMHLTHTPYIGFVVGLFALGAAWFGGERFVLRQIRVVLKAARALTVGDYSTRTGLSRETGEIGELAHTFDVLAEKLEQREKETEKVEETVLTRSLQQTVVGALGQFALVGHDVSALLNQAVLLVSQTLEVEYCCVLELQSRGESMLLRAGVGWKDGVIGSATFSADPSSQPGFTLRAGEPVVIESAAQEVRFKLPSVLMEHGIVSGVSVAIFGQGKAFGVLAAYTTHRRKFSGDEVQFLLGVAAVLAMAIERERTESQLRQ